MFLQADQTKSRQEEKLIMFESFYLTGGRNDVFTLLEFSK